MSVFSSKTSGGKRMAEDGWKTVIEGCEDCDGGRGWKMAVDSCENCDDNEGCKVDAWRVGNCE